ncbi:MAG: hypothetical protein QNL87_03470 [Gammaproteobacteria bacterium]|nr:hypothetical protein [Gammaproteobacteria bacterium]
MKKHLLRVNWGLNLARFTGFLSLALGAVVLLGWYLHEPALIQVNPAFVPMQYNTALGFALGGLALLGVAGPWPRIAGITGVIVLLTGILTLIEYGFGVDLHIDQLFMEHYIDLKTSNPGRMAPNTALCFSLTGVAVLLAALFRGRARITSWTATLGTLIISLGIVALAGYLIGVESAYGWGHMTRMAIHTAAGFIILGVGFVGLAWTGQGTGVSSLVNYCRTGCHRLSVSPDLPSPSLSGRHCPHTSSAWSARWGSAPKTFPMKVC